jgi:hypothetical protein
MLAFCSFQKGAMLPVSAGQRSIASLSAQFHAGHSSLVQPPPAIYRVVSFSHHSIQFSSHLLNYSRASNWFQVQRRCCWLLYYLNMKLWFSQKLCTFLTSPLRSWLVTKNDWTGVRRSTSYEINAYYRLWIFVRITSMGSITTAALHSCERSMNGWTP